MKSLCGVKSLCDVKSLCGVEEPKVDSRALLESSGLVMIETDRSKAQVAAPAEEPQQLGRPRRERPKPAAQEDELQQVETTRK